MLLVLERGWTDLNWSRYVIYSVLVVLGMMIDFFRKARWEPRQAGEEFRGRAALRMALEQSFAIFVVLIGFLVAFKDLAISRLFLRIVSPAAGSRCFTCSTHCCPRGWVPSFSRLALPEDPARGTWGRLRRMEPWLKRNGRFGLAPVGVVLYGDESVEEDLRDPEGREPDELPRILHGMRVSLLLHSNPPTDPVELTRLRDSATPAGRGWSWPTISGTNWPVGPRSSARAAGIS